MAAEELDVEPGTTVTQLYKRLFSTSGMGALPVMYAVNQSYVDEDYVLQSGDEVAFIPPLGGG